MDEEYTKRAVIPTIECYSNDIMCIDSFYERLLKISDILDDYYSGQYRRDDVDYIVNILREYAPQNKSVIPTHLGTVFQDIYKFARKGL